MQNTNSISGQSNYDMCLKIYGGLDNFIKLLSDNSVFLSSQTQPSYPKIDSNEIQNKLVTNYNYNTYLYPGTPLLNNDGTILRNNDGSIIYNNS
jgi:hypothetical protein